MKWLDFLGKYYKEQKKINGGYKYKQAMKDAVKPYKKQLSGGTLKADQAEPPKEADDKEAEKAEPPKEADDKEAEKVAAAAVLPAAASNGSVAGGRRKSKKGKRSTKQRRRTSKKR